MPVRFAFGHGLSYTTFEYSNLKTSAKCFGDDGTAEISVDITNTGKMAGKAVAQLYISDKNGTAGRPVKELKGFAKVALQPGETKTVTMTIDARALSYYHTGLRDWYAPSGKYGLQIGSSSDDIGVEGEIEFVTKKLLPFVVDVSTTIGELMNDPRTSAAIRQMVAERQGARSGSMDVDKASASDKRMREMMMLEMPIKALVNYGVMGAGQMEELIKMLNSLIA